MEEKTHPVLRTQLEFLLDSYFNEKWRQPYSFYLINLVVPSYQYLHQLGALLFWKSLWKNILVHYLPQLTVTDSTNYSSCHPVIFEQLDKHVIRQTSLHLDGAAWSGYFGLASFMYSILSSIYRPSPFSGFSCSMYFHLFCWSNLFWIVAWLPLIKTQGLGL